MVVSAADAPDCMDDGFDATTILCTSLHYWGNHFVINVNLEKMKYRIGRFKLFFLWYHSEKFIFGILFRSHRLTATNKINEWARHLLSEDWEIWNECE